MLLYSLIAVDPIDDIAEIIVNYPDGFMESVRSTVDAYGLRTPISYVRAGLTRQESVRLMLAECRYDNVLIHEAARPLVSEQDFRRLIARPEQNVALVCEIPFSVAVVDQQHSRIVQKLARSSLRNIQLPQKFDREILKAAHALALSTGTEHTEDTTVCLDAGHPVAFVSGPTTNIKITNPEDFALAEILIRGDRVVE